MGATFVSNMHGRCARRACCTLAGRLELSGVGLHSGATARVTVAPARAAEGIYFVRTDRRVGTAEIRIPASPRQVTSTRLSTTLGAGGSTVSTVEHFLAAACGTGVTACRVEVDGPELPLLDGSAMRWLTAIQAVGLSSLATPTRPIRLRSTCWVREDDAWIVALPAAEPQLAYGIEFRNHPPIGRQWFSWAPREGTFAEEVAPARTFGLYEQLEALRSQGLIRGATPDSAIVCDSEQWLTGPLRFVDEPARHKLLDLVGDLALLGTLPCAHVVAWKASHRLHVELARQIDQQQDSASSPSRMKER